MRAFVLSGGASLGSIQVGMMRALYEHHIESDLVVGTSVGAINGSWLAAGQPVDGLAAVWRQLRRADLFPVRPLVGLRGISGRRDHCIPDTGLRRLLTRHVSFDRIEEALVPFMVIATDARTGEEIVLDSGPAIPSILASSALPGLFPPVKLGGRTLIDGGIANNTPITRAIEAGATEVWVLSTGYSCALPTAPHGALTLGLHSVALLVQQRLILELRSRHYDVPVKIIPVPCPITASPTDFSQTESLIDSAYLGTRQWLDQGCPEIAPADRLVHHHDDSFELDLLPENEESH